KREKKEKERKKERKKTEREKERKKGRKKEKEKEKRQRQREGEKGERNKREREQSHITLRYQENANEQLVVQPTPETGASLPPPPLQGPAAEMRHKILDKGAAVSSQERLLKFKWRSATKQENPETQQRRCCLAQQQQLYDRPSEQSIKYGQKSQRNPGVNPTLQGLGNKATPGISASSFGRHDVKKKKEVETLARVHRRATKRIKRLKHV
ncbi:Transcription initiation factor TFIID subunit 3, partial [Ophiophagus hannah]